MKRWCTCDESWAFPSDEHALTARIIELAMDYGRYGYRRVTALLRMEGWLVNPKRVQRIWRQEGLKVPKKQPKRARLWLNDGSCIRLRPERKAHVWAYDFLYHRTHEGRPFRLLAIVDEYTRECLAIEVERKLGSEKVLEQLGELFVQRGIPEHIRSDNGPEFTAEVVRDRMSRLGVGTLFIEPGSPWEKGYASHCTSSVRFGSRARRGRRFESFRPCVLTGGSSPGCSYKHWFLSL